MEFIRIGAEHFQELTALQLAYKAEIGEDIPSEAQLERLLDAIQQERILFYGCICDNQLAACCSVCVGFSTFQYENSGVFEDFYILPEHRHKGIARKLAAYVWQQSGVRSMTVGCADCDVEMYQSIGFRIPLGNLLAYEE